MHDCVACGAVVAEPLKSDESIYAVIYAQPEKIPGYVRYAHYAEEILQQADPLEYLTKQEACYWAVADALNRYLPRRDLSILEVGCGMGYLTYALTQAGYRRVLGIDLSAGAVASARQRYPSEFKVAEVAEFARQTTERFDAVILSEVIEHLESPVDFIAAARSLLRPGGYIICTTPNRDFGGLTAQKWATELPPVHLWWFGERAIRNIAAQLDMTVTLTDFRRWNRRNFHQFCKALKRSRRPERTAEPTLDSTGKLRLPVPSKKHHVHSFKWRLLESWRNALYKLRYPHLWFESEIERSTYIGAVFSARGSASGNTD